MNNVYYNKYKNRKPIENITIETENDLESEIKSEHKLTFNTLKNNFENITIDKKSNNNDKSKNKFKKDEITVYHNWIRDNKYNENTETLNIIKKIDFFT